MTGVGMVVGALIAELVLLALVLLSIAYVRQLSAQRRDRDAMASLVARVRQQRGEREEVIERFVTGSLGLEGQPAEDLKVRLLRDEMALIQRFVDVYRRRESVMAARFDGDVFALLAGYHAIEAAPSVPTDPAEDVGATSMDPDELAQLQADKSRLEDALRITMETMSRMLNDYSSMFGDDDENAEGFPSGPASGAEQVDAWSAEEETSFDGEIHEIDDIGVTPPEPGPTADPVPNDPTTDDVDAQIEALFDGPQAGPMDASGVLVDDSDMPPADMDPDRVLPEEAPQGTSTPDILEGGREDMTDSPGDGLVEPAVADALPDGPTVDSDTSVRDDGAATEPGPTASNVASDMEGPGNETWPGEDAPAGADERDADEALSASSETETDDMPASPAGEDEDPIEQILREARTQEETARERAFTQVQSDVDDPKTPSGLDEPESAGTIEDVDLDDLFDEVGQEGQRSADRRQGG